MRTIVTTIGMVLGVVLSTPQASKAQPANPISSAAEDPEGALIKAILMKQVVQIVEGNISAADRESGEIAKLVRALSGVSIGDIDRYGPCGGPNSEVRKLIGSVCNKIK